MLHYQRVGHVRGEFGIGGDGRVGLYRKIVLFLLQRWGVYYILIVRGIPCPCTMRKRYPMRKETISPPGTAAVATHKPESCGATPNTPQLSSSDSPASRAYTVDNLSTLTLAQAG